jgi:rhodanese-related sulfurtransferase/DNA-binding transcriptional ArsR family regulator
MPARDDAVQRLYSEVSRIAKALSSPSRLQLVQILAQSERTVEALGRELGLSTANVSHHLQALREARLVEARKEGLYVHYRLAGPDVFALANQLRQVGERHLAEMDRLVKGYFRSRDGMEAVPRDELLRRAREGTTIVLDVRPEEEYLAGHIPGAVSVPLDQLATRLEELPREKEVVAYCRGPYCFMAFEAVRILRARGRGARRLEDGFPEWRTAGLPVVSGSGTDDRKRAKPKSAASKKTRAKRVR